jgi:hypothetical protein
MKDPVAVLPTFDYPTAPESQSRVAVVAQVVGPVAKVVLVVG